MVKVPEDPFLWWVIDASISSVFQVFLVPEIKVTRGGARARDESDDGQTFESRFSESHIRVTF